ncbi:MAG: sulfotransferase [Gammaproteobacteria bacterium]|nr:sulfotransferase [Gammaproteobacteria bacterium]
MNARFNVNSKRVLDVFYEDMVKNPSVEISKIMSFLNLEYNNKQILPEYFSNNKRAGSDGFVKLKSAINDSSVGRFKSALSPETICVIESLAKDNLLKLGYL